jgi:hypothetical protein
MRAVIIILLLTFGCGGASVQPEPVSKNAASLAGTYSGFWGFGFANAGGNGAPADPPAVAFPNGNNLTVVALGGDAVEISGFCGDGTGPTGSATSATSATISAASCAGAHQGPCAAGQVLMFTVKGGSATVAGAELNLTLLGGLTGCSSDYDPSSYEWTFTGTRQ